jgi:general secretion pathway protein I
MSRRHTLRRAGLTLVEVMIALAILGMALVLLIKSVATNIAASSSSYYMGVVADLSRGKMYDLEEEQLDKGFQEGVLELEGDFAEEGYPRIKWKATIEPAELPTYDKLMALANGGPGAGSGSGGEAGDGTSATDKFQSSALGGMMSMFGGGGGDAADSAQGAQTGGFIQAQYTLIQNVLKASVRKITLTVSWSTGIHDEQVDFILYVTDPAGMQKALPI